MVLPPGYVILMVTLVRTIILGVSPPALRTLKQASFDVNRLNGWCCGFRKVLIIVSEVDDLRHRDEHFLGEGRRHVLVFCDRTLFDGRRHVPRRNTLPLRALSVVIQLLSIVYTLECALISLVLRPLHLK